MDSSASGRIRGSGQGGASRTRPVRTYRTSSLPGLVVVSVAMHALFIAAVMFMPGLFPEEKKAIKMFSIEMASLPPGPEGGGGEAEEVEDTPLKPELNPPEPDEDAVKLAEKTAKKPEPAPVKQPDKPKPQVAPDKAAPVSRVPAVSAAAPKGPGQGPVGGGREGDKPAGPITLEGGADFPFAFYISAIEKKIGKNWRPPDLTTRAKPKVLVFFRIDRKGRLSDIRVEESSGIAFVDRSALSAVTVSSPLPPLPDEFEGRSLGVHYTFVVGGLK